MNSEIPIDTAITRLHAWIIENGWSGWDPYDIKGHRRIISLAEKSSHSYGHTVAREIMYELFYRFPLTSRKLLNIEPSINPKAMGLFSSAYLSLYRSYGKQEFLDLSINCLEWLLDNPGKSSSRGTGWGYPFDWLSARLIPANTPNGIVTTAAGEAIWQHYRFTGQKKYLDHCQEVAHFLDSLPFDQVHDDKICFSYTPLYINHVHNLNLFVAEYLIKTGMETGHNEWIEKGTKAVSYTLSDQHADGSFDYNGPPEKPKNFIDHYHTGFVIRMLYSIWELTASDEVFTALEKCRAHYVAHFFQDETIPKLLPHRTYRIDIHSCAEAVICLCTLAEKYPGTMELAHKVLSWTIKELQSPSGYFYYGILKSRFTGRTYKSKIAYIRWAQAWMLKALATYTETSRLLVESERDA